MVGCGQIGAAMAERAAAHGLRVLGSDPGGVRPPTQPAPLPALLAAADVVSLHAPLVAGRTT